MTEDQFKEMYQESLRRMNEYAADKPANIRADISHSIRDIVNNHNYYKNKATKGEVVYLCKICGQMTDNCYSSATRERMTENQLCFGHDLWEQRAIEHVRNPNNALIIDGNMYSDGGNSPNAANKSLLGFGGHTFFIRKGGREWSTNNLWNGGTIAMEARDRMVNNAEFFTPCEEYDHNYHAASIMKEGKDGVTSGPSTRRTK